MFGRWYPNWKPSLPIFGSKYLETSSMLVQIQLARPCRKQAMWKMCEFADDFLHMFINLAILRALFGMVSEFTWPEIKGWKGDLQRSGIKFGHGFGDKVWSRLESPGTAWFANYIFLHFWQLMWHFVTLVQFCLYRFSTIRTSRVAFRKRKRYPSALRLKQTKRYTPPKY